MNSAHESTEGQPNRFPVAVILERRKSISPWAEYSWRASGITIGRHPTDNPSQPVRETADLALYVVGGLEITLHADECESYYFNLVSSTPRAYVVVHPASEDSEDPPQPFHVSMSFDEAHAYLEGEDEIFDVDVPAELYLWVEAYVIANYFPEKKRKRKLRDWTADGRNQQPEVL